MVRRSTSLWPDYRSVSPRSLHHVQPVGHGGVNQIPRVPLIIHAGGLPELLVLVRCGPALQPPSAPVGFTREEMHAADT